MSPETHETSGRTRVVGFDVDEQRYRQFCAEMDGKEQAWKDEVADVAGAQAKLDAYVAQLGKRFLHGGLYDTFRIPSGEVFVEFVCGGEFDGRTLCQCYTPQVAVRIFIDTVERYIASVPKAYGPGRNQTLYWRVYPQMRGIDTGEWSRYDEELACTVAKRETLFNVWARLLIL